MAGSEVVNKRTATTSVYANADGSYTAKVYSQPVHYQDAKGNWQDIDTTLVGAADGRWQEKANSGAPTFAAKADATALVSDPLAGGANLSFAVQGASAVDGAVAGNEITYPSLLPHADIRYTANAAGVKETLLLDSVDAPTTWVFPLSLTGVTASLNADGAVVLTNTQGRIVDTITNGYMRDSNIDPRSNEGALSTGVTYGLITVNGQQALQVSLDAAWVHDPARDFPIAVDPTSLNAAGSTYVLSPYRNDYSSDSTLQVGTYDGGSNVANAYLTFNVGAAFTNDYIEAASLVLDNSHSFLCSSTREVDVSPILNPWSVTGLKTYPWVSYGAPIGKSSFAAGDSCGGAKWESIDIGDNPSAAGTQLLESWAHGGGNLGLAVTASSTDSYAYKQFQSVNSPYPPYLTITYSPYGADYSPAGIYYVPTASLNGSQQVTITNRGTGTWTPGAESLGYQLFTTSWQQLSVGAVTTPLPGNVGPNQTVTVNGTIGALAPGQYILCWDMMAGSTSFNVGYGVPTAGCEVINSNNTPPQIDSMTPLSNTAVGTLTPTLFATGHDPDNYPGNGLTYDFQVYTAPTDGTAAALVIDSGWLGQNVASWVIPSGKLSWNQTYSWIVQNNDGVGTSNWSDASFLSTAVGQPLITSHIGAASSAKGFDPGVGDYTTTATDATVSVVGPALTINRSYNSQDPRTGNLFGAGWSTMYDMSAVADADGSGDVVVTYPDGHTVRFGLDPDGVTFAPPQGMYATFQAVSSGGYTLTDRGGTTYTFTTHVGMSWQLTSITDADGRVETMSYTQGHLATVTNSASHRSLHFTWTGAHVTQVATDPVTTGGQPLTWTYTYTGDQLTSVCPPTSPSKCTAYTYTSGGTPGSHYPSTVLDAQPTGYWRLNEPTGTVTAADQVQANLGTNNATYSTSAFGHYQGPAVGSPSTGAYFAPNAAVTLPNNLVESTTYLSVQLWFQAQPNAPAEVLFSTGHSAFGTANPDGGSMPVLYIGTDGKLYGQFWTGAVAPVVSTGKVNDGNWHQATIVGQGSSQSMYLDGNLVGTHSGNLGNFDPYDLVGAGVINANAWVNGPPQGWSEFTGLISDVAFYDHPLGGPAIAQQYAAAVSSAAELSSITSPGGASIAQVSYDNIHDRATNVTDVHGGNWKISTPSATGSDLAFVGAVRNLQPTDFWPLSDSSGTSAVNETPPNNLAYGGGGGYVNGTYQNVTLGEPGPIPGSPDTSAGFDGASSSLSLGAPGGSYPELGLWFKTANPGVLLSDNGIPDLYVGSDGKLHGDFNGTGMLTIDTIVTDNKWHFASIEAIWQSSSTNDPDLYNEYLYLDDANTEAVDAELTAAQGQWLIGAGTAPSDGSNAHFAGDIADVVAGSPYYNTLVVFDPVIAAMKSAQSSATPISTVTVTDPGNATPRYTYDLANGGRLAKRTDGLGNITTYGYDSNGFTNVITEPDLDQISSSFDTRGDTTYVSTGTGAGTYTYPAAGTYSGTDPRDDKPLTFTDRDNNTTNYTYSSGGDLLSSTNAIGAVTTNTYTAGTEPAVGGGTEPPGLLASQKDPLGHVTKYSYDSAGDIAQVVTPSGLTTIYASDNLGRRVSEKQVSDTFPGGVTATYTYDGNGRLLTQTGPATTDAVTGAVHTPQTTDTYDVDGDLLTTTVADTTGGDAARTATNTYNTDDEPTSTTDPANRKTTYGYDAYGNQTSVTDAAGDSYAFSYDANGDLLTTTLNGWTGNSITPGTPTNLVVDSRAYDPDGLLASQTDAMGRTTTSVYTPSDHWLSGSTVMVSQSPNEYGAEYGSSYQYDQAGNPTWVAGPSGDHSITYTYDATNRVATSDGEWGGQLPNGGYEYLEPATTYTYNVANELTSESTPNGATTNQTSYGYDSIGDRTSQTVINGATDLTTSWTYDERGVETSETDPRGNVAGASAAAYTTAYIGDAAGRIMQVIQPTANAESNGSSGAAVHPLTEYGYNTFGDQTSVSDPDGNITTNTYDPDSELTAVSQPEYTAPGTNTTITPTTTSTYTPLGQVATITDPLGNVTTNTYDQLGDLVQQQQPAINGTTPATTYTYDNDGEQLSTTDPTGAQTQSTYDEIGQVLTQTHIVRQPTQRAETTVLGYDLGSYQRDAPTSITTPAGLTTNYTWDQAGQPLSITDATGDSTIYTYDLDLNQTKVTYADGTAATTSYDAAEQPIGTAQLDATGKVLATTSTGYDPAGNPVSSIDANNVTTTSSYDASNTLVQQVQPTSTSASIIQTYGYDAARNLTRYTDGNGNNTDYTYNSLGQLESRIDPATTDYSTPAQRTTTQSYDADGHVTGITAPGGVSQHMVYDPLGQLGSQSGSGAEAPTQTRTFGYDLDGRLTSASTPTGADTYTYDDTGNVLSASGPSGTASYGYNADGQLTSRHDNAGTASYTYDTDGRLSAATDPTSGDTATYAYNSLGQITGVSYGTGNAAQTNTYNAQHQLTGHTLTAAGGAVDASNAYGYDSDGHVTSQTTTGTVGASANTYTYDEAGRLSTWNNGTATVNYGYDADGNRTQDGSLTAQYNQRDQITSIGSTNYTYTARGSLATETTGPTTVNYADDAFDQLASVGSTSYSYDSLGRLAASGGHGFSYDGTSTTPTSDGTDSFGYDANGKLLSVGTPTGANLAFTDQHGDVTGLFTATGSSLTGSIAFDPFGQSIVSQGTQSSLGYQGGWTDPTTGDVGTASRWYAPTTGSFTSHDTISDPTGSSAAANAYAYGNDDPLDNSDPSGHDPVDPGGCYLGLASADPWTILWETLLGDCIQVLPGGDCNGALYNGQGQPCPGVCQQDPGISGCGHAAGRTPPSGHEPKFKFPTGSKSLTGRLTGRSHDGGGGGKHKPRPPALHNPDPKPINAPPQGQTPPPGDTETPEPGTKGPDSGPGDTPMPTDPIGEPNPDEQDPIYEPTDQPQAPDTRPQPLPPDQLPVPLPNPYQQALDACFDNGSPSEPIYGPMQGAVDNGKKGKRATGVIACLTKVGATDNREPAVPFGYDSSTMHRSHLLARSLGGTSDVQNIVPLYAFVNTPLMYRGYEAAVARAVRSGQRVFYEAQPLYDGNSPIPWSVEIHAQGSGGFTCDVILYNQAGKGGQRSTC